MVDLPIYLDNHSTTKIDDEVIEAMLPYFKEYYGNSSSKTHCFGWKADAAVERSRNIIAKNLGCLPEEIIFTSGATESNNLAIRGTAIYYRQKGNHIISTSIEHSSVFETVKYLEKQGFEITFIDPEPDGVINPSKVENAIKSNTILVSIMTANNEIGTIQPVNEIAQIANNRNILFHTDAVQAIGKINFSFEEIKADLVSFNAHKIHGPKGIGGLFIRKKQPQIRLLPLLFGGGHERGLRPGTLNVPLIVGLAKTIEIAVKDLSKYETKVKSLRDRLLKGLFDNIPDTFVNGSLQNRLPNNLNIRFKGIKSEILYSEIKDIAFSVGSACSSNTGAASHVLRAIGLSDKEILSSIRFGLSKYNSETEIDYTIQKFTETVTKLRKSTTIGS